uniref:Uncharacterized protein n=1 Tax=Triticum urartu TaxID=4572 RepID=A0A8R7Q151_TRIUA
MRGGGGRGPGRRAGGRRGASQARRVTGRARPCGGRGGELCLRHRGWRVGRACCWRRGAPYAAPRPPARQDYISTTRNYHTIFISHIPPMSMKIRDKVHAQLLLSMILLDQVLYKSLMPNEVLYIFLILCLI